MKLFDIDKLLDTLTSYLETKLEIFKLDLKEEIGSAISKVIIYIIVGVLGIIAFAFALLALATFLNELLESNFLGYLIDVGIIFIAIAILYLKKEKIAKLIMSRIESGDQVVNQEDEQ